MADQQNWRTEVNAIDYFGHQKKQLQVADRRPVIRKASDLVGPGIGADAVRIADFNNQLATFNGYFSAVDGTPNAPDSGAFIGTVTGDSELGGKQVFTRLSDGVEYTRTFVRNAADPNTIYWSAWSKALNSLDAIYPIGKIYMSIDDTDPGDLFGGTWVPWGEGQVPVGVDTGDSDFNTAEETGGEKTHLLTAGEMPSHTHTGPSHTHDLPSHSHVMRVEWRSTGAGSGSQVQLTDLQNVTGTANTAANVNTNASDPGSTGSGGTGNTGSAGGGGAHNNLQPYITCYMWKRTA